VRPIALAFLCLLALLVPIASQAQDGVSPIERRAAQVVGLMRGDTNADALEELFTPTFLGAITPEQLTALFAQLRSLYGEAQRVESVTPPGATRAALAIRMDRAIVRGGIAIDPAQGGRVSELLFQSFQPLPSATAGAIEAELAALPGTVTAYFGPLDAGPPRLSHNPDVQNALGSTMKLYLLAQLGREVAQGKRAWSDVAALSTRSFPSGMMQDWPEGAPVTLHKLASLMISISDNTATDILTRVLGQEAIADMVRRSGHADPALNAPWLTTRELFLLKGGERSRMRAYLRGSAQERARILAGIERPPVSVDDVNAAFAKGPVALGIEWFASPRDLAGLLRTMRAESDPQVFEIMAINESFPAEMREQWRYVGYKGGSEPGVLNLTWLLTDRQGRDHILTLGWSNPEAPVDEARLEALAWRILAERG
jgi:beta-lactamase class A